MKKVLTIAGSDSSGGAGIQADIKTITAHKMYAMSAITALTAQNTTGVYGISEVSPQFVAQQIDCIFNDIRPDSVKIGMVSSSAIIETIVEKLREHSAEKIVVDPVMVATSGSKLISDEACDTLISKLIPIATVITPNIPEAEVLCGFEIKDEDGMVRATGKDPRFGSARQIRLRFPQRIRHRQFRQGVRCFHRVDAVNQQTIAIAKIDQAGNELKANEGYTLTFYYHSDTSLPPIPRC